MNSTQIELYAEQFGEREKPLVTSGPLSANLFRFPSGVCTVRLRSDRGELVMLPFQGQQIWSAQMAGRSLTMKSMFDQPYPTREFLATFGAFMVHCGASGVGAPGPQDTHPLHGELPNAPYQTAQVSLGEDKKGAFIGLTGAYQHIVAFNFNYIAQPTVRLYAGSTVFQLSMTITNRKQTPMPLLYLAHINFKPVDHARLVTSAPSDPDHMRVRASVPDFMVMPPGYREFLAELKENPSRHEKLEPGLPFNPEVVFYIDFQAGADGWARQMQLHPDGSADVVRHRPAQLDHGARWICRIPEQDALGFEPGTSEVEGYTAELKKGNVRSLGAGQSFHCDIEVGYLSPAEAAHELALIDQILAR